MSFKDKLREIREAKGLNRKELAERSGVSYPYLCQVESGARATPKPEMLHKLAYGLDCPVEELLKAAGYITEKNEPLDLEILLLKDIKYKGELLTTDDKEFILRSLNLISGKEKSYG